MKSRFIWINVGIKTLEIQMRKITPSLQTSIYWWYSVDLQQNWKRFYNALGFAGYAKKKLFGFRKSARTPHCGMSIRISI